MLGPVLANDHRMPVGALDRVEVPGADVLSIGVDHDLGKRLPLADQAFRHADLVENLLRADMQDHRLGHLANAGALVDDARRQPVTGELVGERLAHGPRADDQNVGVLAHPATPTEI